MVEDFFNQSNDTVLSAIPVQFLIQIVTKPLCLLKPIITSNGAINNILDVGETIHFALIIQTNCVGRTIEFFRTAPLDMKRSNLTYDGLTNQYTVTETWTPTSDQSGSQVYCATAIDR